RHPPQKYQNYERGASASDRQQLVGEIADIDGAWLTIDVKNKFVSGDLMELVTPAGNVTFELHELINKDGHAVNVAPGSGHVVRIPLPEAARGMSLGEYCMLVRYLPQESALEASA
ncbi:MAG: U32 family peptidase C-terminal domain-containing protein, partial [Gammaproteobacteria bacterium]|nr:U32 family peptidase C-terminal domain-containing protein [Gammaproteobacteria bacterium]